MVFGGLLYACFSLWHAAHFAICTRKGTSNAQWEILIGREIFLQPRVADSYMSPSDVILNRIECVLLHASSINLSSTRTQEQRMS